MPATGSSALIFKCSQANKCKDATKALKLPMLLEREGLTIWLELSEEVQGRYENAKEEIKARMMPMEFVTGRISSPLIKTGRSTRRICA